MVGMDKISRTREWYEREASYPVWLEWYRNVEHAKYQHPDATVDCMVLTFDADADDPLDSLKALIVQRWTHPFRGSWSLPGTFLHVDDEDAENAVERMLVERFHVRSADGTLQQFRTFTGADRDPRGQVVSIAHMLYISNGVSTIAGIDGVEWVPLRTLANGGMDLAFDHDRIVDVAIARLRDQFGWTPNVFRTLPTPFTLTDAIRLRASLFDEPCHAISRANFRKKYQSMWREVGLSDPSDPRSSKLFALRR